MLDTTFSKFLSGTFEITKELWPDVHIDHLAVNQIYNDEKELWHRVVFEGKWEKLTLTNRFFISNYGRIYDSYKDKLLVPRPKKNDKDSYNSIQCYFNKDNAPVISLPRTVLISFIGYDPEKKYVRHKDGNRFNVILWNLEWDSECQRKKKDKKDKSIWSEKDVQYVCELLQKDYTETPILARLKDENPHDTRYTYENIHKLVKEIITQTKWTEISDDYLIEFKKKKKSKKDK